MTLDDIDAIVEAMLCEDIEEIVDAGSTAVGSLYEPKAGLMQPPLGLRYDHELISRQQPLVESHELYGLAASICVGELEFRPPISREMLFEHLWNQWPKETRGPAADPESDEEAAWAAESMSVEEITQRLGITEKAVRSKSGADGN